MAPTDRAAAGRVGCDATSIGVKLTSRLRARDSFEGGRSGRDVPWQEVQAMLWCFSARPLFDTPLRGFALSPDQTSRNSGTLENYHCRTRPSSLKLAKDYSASGASNGLMVGAKRKGPAAPAGSGAHCDMRSRNITRSRTGIAEAAERLNPGQSARGGL